MTRNGPPTKLTTPPLEAEYSPAVACPTIPMIDAVLMIQPRSPLGCGSCSSIWAVAYSREAVSRGRVSNTQVYWLGRQVWERRTASQPDTLQIDGYDLVERALWDLVGPHARRVQAVEGDSSVVDHSRGSILSYHCSPTLKHKQGTWGRREVRRHTCQVFQTL